MYTAQRMYIDHSGRRSRLTARRLAGPAAALRRRHMHERDAHAFNHEWHSALKPQGQARRPRRSRGSAHGVDGR
jgi:hypothetical protein